MYKKAIDKKTYTSLGILKTREVLKDFYLAGGTALALHLGHRCSYDLDLFSENKFNTATIVSELKKASVFEVDVLKDDTVEGVFNGVKMSLFYYPYRLIGDFSHYQGIKIASIADIGCMKIAALVNRGAKRDFIDLYFICHYVFPLTKLLSFYEKKYGVLSSSMINIKKSLVYFDDAEMDEMPTMIKKVRWSDVKKYFIKEVFNLKV